MTTGPQADEERRLAAAAALVNVVASHPGGTLPCRQLGEVVRQMRVLDHSRDAVDHELGQALETIPLRFTVRDGWWSPELWQHVRDACALGALTLTEGGVLRPGPRADAYLLQQAPGALAKHVLVSVPSLSKGAG